VHLIPDDDSAWGQQPFEIPALFFQPFGVACPEFLVPDDTEERNSLAREFPLPRSQHGFGGDNKRHDVQLPARLNCRQGFPRTGIGPAQCRAMALQCFCQDLRGRLLLREEGLHAWVSATQMLFEEGGRLLGGRPLVLDGKPLEYGVLLCGQGD